MKKLRVAKSFIIGLFSFVALLLGGKIKQTRANHFKKKPVIEITETSPNEIKVNDTSFISKYSGILGVKLDSCSNRQLISTVADWLGTPYRRAGMSKLGTDCSGFVSSVYREIFNVNLTHSSFSMLKQMKERVKKAHLQEGDIIFFRMHGKKISHVGIYLKDFKFIHAATNRGIVVDDLRTPYYQRTYYTAGRAY
jgi:probable lipoprotein NlpC